MAYTIAWSNAVSFFTSHLVRTKYDFTDFQFFGSYFIVSMKISTALRNSLYETLVHFQMPGVNLCVLVSFLSWYYLSSILKGMHSIYMK